VREKISPGILFIRAAGMTTLAVLDKELEKQLRQIEQLETELFFKRLWLAGLKSAKDALLRELVVSDKEVEQGGEKAT